MPRPGVVRCRGGAAGGALLACLLHSEVVGRQPSVVDVEDQAGVVGGGVEHLDRDTCAHTHTHTKIMFGWHTLEAGAELS